MNSRQRFIESLAYGQPDRVPLFEEGIRDEVISAWRNEGLPGNAQFFSLFPVDAREEVALDVEPRPELSHWSNQRSLLEILRRRLDPEDPARLPADWSEKVKAWHRRDHVLMLRVNWGFFQTLGVEGWSRFEEVIYLVKENPRLVRDIMLLQGDFTARLLERVLADVEVDAAVFSEPISGNHGPLISPKMFEELVLVGYEPILARLRQFGVNNLIMRTYANSRSLLPAIVESGFNCLWACESPPGSMDYSQIRKEYGRDLRLIGGVDVDLLLGDKETLCREIEELLPPLLTDGGFIPLADGRIRGHVPYENYVAYRQLLMDLTTAKASR
jgi:hypothetical protein